jgi:sulfate adenylyltransferase
MSENLISPHGGRLVNLMAVEDRREELRLASREWPSWDLTPRQMCDLELLLAGGFSPLQGFMTRHDHASVCKDMRLADGTLWPIPITLDVSAELAEGLSPGDGLALRDPEGVMLAILHVEDVWERDAAAEAEAIHGTTDPTHPGVDLVARQSHEFNVGGRLEGVQLPAHYDFRSLRHTPAELRGEFTRLGWRRIAAFQTMSPMHHADRELTLRAAKENGANLLIHPVVGMTRPGDLDHYTRVRCYRHLLPRYPQHTVKLSLLPLAMRHAGPREALWSAIIRKNYGCTHYIVDRDNGADDALQLLGQHRDELGVEIVPFRTLGYLPDEDAYVPEDEIPADAKVLSISGTELRQRLDEGREVPEWFTYPEVAHELERRYPPRYRQGFTVFFTGLSGAGKSTIANVLFVKFLETGGRPVTLLDGDIVRKNLSSELGFSREHRNLNIHRIGFVASEITKNGGIAICAPIAPYDRVRRDVREMITPLGGFILVHVSTPLDVCETRDRKGLYAKARAGIVKEFTGISDPYEVPEDADVVLDTSGLSPEESAQEVLLYLERQGYVGAIRQD